MRPSQGKKISPSACSRIHVHEHNHVWSTLLVLLQSILGIYIAWTWRYTDKLDNRLECLFSEEAEQCIAIVMQAAPAVLQTWSRGRAMRAGHLTSFTYLNRSNLGKLAAAVQTDFSDILPQYRSCYCMFLTVTNTVRVFLSAQGSLTWHYQWLFKIQSRL